MKPNCAGSLVAEQMSFQIEGGGSIPTSALQLNVKLINKETAALCYRKWHYLGEKGFIATYSFGAYYDGRIWGGLSFHPPSAPETVKGIFNTTDQRGVFEIGRLAMDDLAPKNSESRFIAIAIKLLRHIETVKAIITYADTAQGHTGIIYKASGFKYMGLTSPKKDFYVNGKIQERGKTHGVNGIWRDRPRKHLFVMELGVK